MSSPQKAPIAIIGGGLGGLTLSIGLTYHGIHHKIYESAAAFAEIGAGIALGPNSITALELIDPRIKEVLDRCVSYNEGLDAQGQGLGKEEWLDIRVGTETDFNSLITTIRHKGPKPGRACVHRARFLEGLVELIPPGIAEFGKSLVSISEVPSTKELSLAFADGTTALAGAVVACDGIKSVIRQHYVLSDLSEAGEDISRPVPTGDIAYRGMFPRAQFLEIVGDAIDAGKGTLFCGLESYVVMYPVEKGSMMNMVAIKNIPEAAAQANKKTWVQDVNTETMISDFAGWGAPIKALLAHFKSSQRWALYDHLPAPTYIKGKVTLMGDAAHATTPHQGQGAGMAFEDSLILSNILGQVLSKVPGSGAVQLLSFDREIKACFKAYDDIRRVRTQKVTSTSREMGEIVGFRKDGTGGDLVKMRMNFETRMDWIWDVDLPGEIVRGVDIARNLMNGSSL